MVNASVWKLEALVFSHNVTEVRTTGGVGCALFAEECRSRPGTRRGFLCLGFVAGIKKTPILWIGASPCSRCLLQATICLAVELRTVMF